MNVRELCERIVRHDLDVTRHHALVVSGDDGSLAGIVTRSDVVRALNKTPELSVLKAGSRNLVAAFPDELVVEAADRLLRNDIGRPGILRARMQRVHEEHTREAVLL